MCSSDLARPTTVAAGAPQAITGFQSIQSADIVFKPAVPAARFFQAAAAAETAATAETTPFPTGEAPMNDLITPIPDAAAVEAEDSVQKLQAEAGQLGQWIAATRASIHATASGWAVRPGEISHSGSTGPAPAGTGLAVRTSGSASMGPCVPPARAGCKRAQHEPRA